MSDYGEKLLLIQQKSGLSQRDLAKVLKLDNSTLHKIQTGKTQVPTPEVCRKIDRYHKRYVD